MSKPTDKGDYGINPSEEDKKNLADKEKKAFLEQDNATDNNLESGDNPEERQQKQENQEEARELGQAEQKTPKGENL
jgi:hypothetical protein